MDQTLLAALLKLQHRGTLVTWADFCSGVGVTKGVSRSVDCKLDKDGEIRTALARVNHRRIGS